MRKRALSLLLAMALVLGLSVGASAASAAPTDLNRYLLSHTSRSGETRSLPIDRTEVNEHPVIGYYTYTFQDGEAAGRSFKLYVGQHAALRAYITVIALPDGIADPYAFLQEQGWLEQADTYGELLFVLEPGQGGWGTPDSEAAYLEACLGEVIGNDAGGTRETAPGGVVQTGKVTLSDGTTCSFFTGHSCNYYVGYGEGCAVLESWTAENPLYVISQAFIGGKSVGSGYLDQAAARTYNGYNVSTYHPGYSDEDFTATLTDMKNDGAIASAKFMTNADVPVPTLFAGYPQGDASVSYWKNVNDAYAVPTVDGLYRQSISSSSWTTRYANQNAKTWDPNTRYGISQVRVEDGADLNAAQIRDFLAAYTRYTYQFAYSNNLAYRLDYYQSTKAARTAAESGKAIATYTFDGYDGSDATVELRALESTRVSVPGSLVGGTVYSCISAFNDYDSNGVLDPRESLIYIPDSVKNNSAEGAPVLVVFPGMTQAASTFMDCSGYWAVANDEGCVLLIMGEYCNSSAASLIYGDEEDNVNMTRSALLLLDQVVSKQAGVQLDLTRVYGTGHSLGSRTVQTLTHNSEAYYFAAVASTSFNNTQFTADSMMPSYLLAGQADIDSLVAAPWLSGDNNSIHDWVTGALKMNGLDVTFTPNDHASFLAACSSYDESGRYYTYTWADSNSIPLVQFTRTLAREHNCYPEEFRLAWDFLEHYRLAEDGTRYYSPSAFANNDAVTITKG